MTDEAIREEIRARLAARPAGSTICPSEVARALAPQDWRPLMQPVRDEAARLADAGELEVTQREEMVDVRTTRGPVRLRASGS